MKLSIIIPVYNVGESVRKCLASIMDNKSQNFQCIIVNDGSTDNTCALINGIIKNDFRFSLISIKNQGVSNARNVGIENAIGEDITFIDGDDFFEENVIDLIIEEINDDYDLFIYSYNERKDKRTYKRKFENQCITSNECIEKFIAKNMQLNTCWAKIYKKDIILKHSLQFLRDMKIGEDSVFVMDYITYSKKIKFSSKLVLTYNNTDTNTMSKYKVEWFRDYIVDLKIRESCLKKINGENKNEIYTMYLNLFMYFFIAIANTKSTKDLKALLENKYTEEFKSFLLNQKRCDKGKLSICNRMKWRCMYKNDNYTILLFKILSQVRQIKKLINNSIHCISVK